MPQITAIERNITTNLDYNNGVNPVTRTIVLEPISSKDGLVTYAGGIRTNSQTDDSLIEAPTTVTALQPTLSVSLSRPSKTSRIAKVRVKLVIPVAALDLEGKKLPTKSHENSADITYMFSEKSALVERDQIQNALGALLTSPDFRQVLVELKSLY